MHFHNIQNTLNYLCPFLNNQVAFNDTSSHLAQKSPNASNDTANTYIVADGLMPTNPAIIHCLRQSWQNGAMIIACDGAANYLVKKLNIIPQYIVGDLDSLDGDLKQQLQAIIRHDGNQNNNDLTKAINFARSLGDDNNIIILGASGKREDHTLANLALLNNYANMCSQALIMLTDYVIISAHSHYNASGTYKQFTCTHFPSSGKISPLKQKLKQNNNNNPFYVYLPTIKGQQISFFAFSAHARLSCSQLKWPLANFQLDTLYGGSLNQATNEYINVMSDANFLVMRAFALK